MLHYGEHTEDPRIAAQDAKYPNPWNQLAELIDDANSGCEMATDMLEDMDAFRCEECGEWFELDERANIVDREKNEAEHCDHCAEKLTADFITHDGRNLGPTLAVVWSIDEAGDIQERAFAFDGMWVTANDVADELGCQFAWVEEYA